MKKSEMHIVSYSDGTEVIKDVDGDNNDDDDNVNQGRSKKNGKFSEYVLNKGGGSGSPKLPQNVHIWP